MNWDAIGAIGEVVGALGVITSLLYLATQVRAANRGAQVHAKLESTGLLNDFIDGLIMNPELDELMRRGRKDLAALEPDEYHRFSNMALKGFWFFSAGRFQLVSGTLGQDEWQELYAVFHYWIDGAGTRRWWDIFGHASFGPEFRAWVEGEIQAVLRVEAQESREDRAPVTTREDEPVAS